MLQHECPQQREDPVHASPIYIAATPNLKGATYDECYVSRLTPRRTRCRTFEVGEP
jgi:hypothetical protein